MEQMYCNIPAPQYGIFSSNAPTLLYYSHIPVIIIAILFGLLIIVNNKKAILNRLLFFISIAFSGWLILDIVQWTTNIPGVAIFTWSLAIVLEVLVFAATLYLVSVFSYGNDISLKKKLTMLTLLLPVIIALPTRYLLEGVILADCSVFEGPIATYYTYALELAFVLWILFVCTRAFKKAAVDLKKQIVLIGAGSILFLMAFSYGNIVGSITDDWELAQIGIFGMPIFLGFLSYLVVKYKAFTSKLIAAQALVWILGFAVSALLFVRTIENVRYVVLGTLVLVITTGYILVRSVKREIEQRRRLQDLSLSLEKSNLGLAEANDKLKGLDKLKTEFLSLASHQLRSPLTAIKGYTSMLSEGAFGPLAEAQDGAVKRIYTSAQGLVNIVEDLLNVSKIEQGGMKYEFSPTDIAGVVTQLYEEMKVPAESKGLTFTLEMEKHDKCIVSADATKIKQVFLNLVDNSIKYTQKGFVKISLKREGDNIVFAVTDNGMGISPETKAKLFEKFSRGEGGKTNTGGSGLGLYLAQQIARAHKGDVLIESPGLGKGSTFLVTLPATGSYPN
jgi:signal transduction histidine kinase